MWGLKKKKVHFLETLKEKGKEGIIELIGEKNREDCCVHRWKVLPEQPGVSSGTDSSDDKPALLF